MDVNIGLRCPIIYNNSDTIVVYMDNRVVKVFCACHILSVKEDINNRAKDRNTQQGTEMLFGEVRSGILHILMMTLLFGGENWNNPDIDVRDKDVSCTVA